MLACSRDSCVVCHPHLQRINEKPVVVVDYESGRAIPNDQILAKMERTLGVCVCVCVCTHARVCTAGNCLCRSVSEGGESWSA